MRVRLLVLSVLFVSCWWGLSRAATAAGLPPREELAGLPRELAGWTSVADIPLEPNILQVLGADDYVNRRYTNGGRQLSLYVGYYGSQRQGDSIHSPLNCLPGSGWQPVRQGRLIVPAATSSTPDRATVAVNDVIVQKGEDRHVVLYWYQSHGRVVASEYSAKAFLFFDAMRTGRTDAALVRIVSPVQPHVQNAERDAERAALAFATGLLPTLDRHIPN